MRTLLLSLMTLDAAAASLAAQASGAGAAFNGLRTPVSPAFVVLGIAPTDVERPNTPADLALTVLNHSAGFPTLPKDVALEISPYWLIKHPTLTWQADTTRSIGTSIARTMTISFATAELGTVARPVTGLALGFRAAPFSGRLSQSAIAQLHQLGSRLKIETDLVRTLKQARQSVLDSVASEQFAGARNDSERQAIKARFDSAKAELLTNVTQSSEYKAAVDSTEALFHGRATIRGGFVLEVAAAAALQAPGGVADSARLARWGAWVTAGYEGSALSFVFVNRFLASSVDSSFHSVDAGTRLVYTTGRYALSAEGTFRTFTKRGAPANQYRVAAVVDFELQKGLWLTGTFGRDYTAGAPGSLIAQFGLSLNVAGERIPIPLR